MWVCLLLMIMWSFPRFWLVNMWLPADLYKRLTTNQTRVNNEDIKEDRARYPDLPPSQIQYVNLDPRFRRKKFLLLASFVDNYLMFLRTISKSLGLVVLSAVSRWPFQYYPWSVFLKWEKGFKWSFIFLTKVLQRLNK